MEQAVQDSAVFVLFASKSSTSSPWVKFEIDVARSEQIKRANHRILIFPTDTDVKVSDLPKWLQAYWMPKAGMNANDIARYITNVLLAPDYGISNAAVRVVGRGKTLDKVQQLYADHIVRFKQPPNIFIFANFTGIGRRTFAQYLMKQALSGDANLPYGPQIALPHQTDLPEIYRALRNEVDPSIDTSKLGADLSVFATMNQADQIAEINRQLKHFTALGQAVILISESGFFEDRGDPKPWVAPLFDSIPNDACIFVITIRQFPEKFASTSRHILQYRIEELDDKDIRTLMVLTAARLRVENFQISDVVVRAIGGHADIANAAVRLVDRKGAYILERDPRLLFDIQELILGESIRALRPLEEVVLNVLSWVPSLGGNLLERIVYQFAGVSSDDFVGAVENLRLACLISTAGYALYISPSIRLMYRRHHVSSPELLATFAAVLTEEWASAESNDQFRSDLFDAFVFMHALEGKTLPNELRSLLMPGTLDEVIRDTYARGRDDDDDEALRQVIAWGEIANDMRMSEATREEILSTVVRAKIRLGMYEQAYSDVAQMQKRGYRSAFFLRGYALRCQERYPQAIEVLKEAVEEGKYFRGAVHELALSYKKASRHDDLRALLKKHASLIRDSAMFTDFQIGLDLARNDLPAVEAGIANLRRKADDDGKADRRQAQLLMRKQFYTEAKNLLSRLLGASNKGRFMLRALRAIAAARGNPRDFALARQDIEFIGKMPGRKSAAMRLDAMLLSEEGNLDNAQKLWDQIPNKGAEDWLLQARIFELRADQTSTGLAERQEWLRQASAIRAQYHLAYELDFEE